MKQSEILVISLGVFLTVLAWVISDFYHTSIIPRMKINTQLPKIANYEINIKTLEELKQRQP